ncbi:MAG: citrate synthase [Coriobacteriales bacterium]|jgi:citrate synthase|nr:citrate synthase [Coriobacteriales bacterium]
MNTDRLSLYKDFEVINAIDPEIYARLDVKRGLRNTDGTGVIAGVTNISNVHGYVLNEAEKQPCEGRLTMRGYDINDLVAHVEAEDRFGFEELAYLLLAGRLPTVEQLASFRKLIDENRELPDGFCADIIMTKATPNVMNALTRAISVLYAFDKDAESNAPEHEIDTAISLISRLPRVMVLAYYAKRAVFFGDSMIMHRFIPGQSTSETILSMLRPDRKFTHEEAALLDIMLMLHAEHGGGNNSTFIVRALTSSDTDPYSAYAGGIGSLKGARHGGANLQVEQMQDDIKQQVANWSDEGQVADYLRKIVRREAFDRSGLIYGMGHAVYTLSDPRALLCKKHAIQLAKGTPFEDEFELLQTIERLAPGIIAEQKGDSKQICANIDMYSGLVYRMLGIPQDLLTPMFASSRIVGWAAHRFEEIISGRRIMRPAYKSNVTSPSTPRLPYVPLQERV